VKTLDDLVRDLVRQELAKLLGPEQTAPEARVISDLDRQRARAALRRAGIALGAESPKGRKGAR
jgi:hypothetical protein